MRSASWTVDAIEHRVAPFFTDAAWPRSDRNLRRHRRRDDAQIMVADLEQTEAKLVPPILHAGRKVEHVEQRLDRGFARLEPAHVAAERTEAAAHIEAVRHRRPHHADRRERLQLVLAAE